VEGHIGNVTDLAFLEPGSVNFAFASNLFEHISQEAFASVLSRLKDASAPGATLNIVQPNYYYAYREYFDDCTHRSVCTNPLRGNSVVRTVLRNWWSLGMAVRSREASFLHPAAMRSLPILRLTGCPRERRAS
jgi:hypothetical protein